jgi:CDP-6-deoxy-D-xylo-4-hexulose-3-dehydrase
MSEITLAKDTINREDIDKLIEWLKTYPRLTKGPLTLQLEEKWSTWLGRNYSLFCNSGSSANLLMLAALLEGEYIRTNDKIVVPALSWATDLAPVMQLGLEPVLCDINLKNLSVDLEHLENIFETESPAALLLVSVLGLVPDMDSIVRLCNKYNVILLEDVCESMGSTYNGKKLGTFGLMCSFSTYFGHHISTIEGGFVSTDDADLMDILCSIRSHGWDRDMDPITQKKLRKEWDVDEFNSFYTFYFAGFNLRSTDLQAFIGLGQIDKLDYICEERNKNYLTYLSLLDNPYWTPEVPQGTFVSNFAFPVIHPNRASIAATLQENNIETRPLICGSLGTQPYYVKKYGKKNLPNASVVDKYGFYLPNHALLTTEEVSLVCGVINKGIKL